jgi:chromosome segregation ATPase
MMSMATIRQNSKALQEKIASLANGKRTPSGGSTSTPDSELESKQALISTLQERLTSMEEENSRLRTELSGAQEAVEKVKVLEMVRKERDEAVSQKAEVESQLKIAERNVKERSTKIESLERSLQSSAEALSSQRTDSEARLKELRDQLDDTVNLTNSLKEAVEVKSNEAGQNEGIIKAKNTEIELLDSRVKKACAELDDVRRELTSQVDELRMAGQETIALYEERLSAADAKRYELEDLIESLEERVKKQEQPVSPSAILENMSEAARIDHETMREQIVHLQKKITMLEDALEDAQVVADREEAAVRARIQRFKEAEVTMKKEVADARREIENLRKAEVTAKDRVAELEEALREEGMALENARADVESLRAEVAVSTIQIVCLSSGLPTDYAFLPCLYVGLGRTACRARRGRS